MKQLRFTALGSSIGRSVSHVGYIYHLQAFVLYNHKQVCVSQVLGYFFPQ